MQHLGPIAGVAAHGLYVATAGNDNRLILWDAKTRTALARATHDHLITIQLGMGSDGAGIGRGGHIFAGDDLGRIAIIDDNAEPEYVQAHAASIKRLALAHDGATLVTLGHDRAIAVWSLQSGRPQKNRAQRGGTYALFDPAGDAWDMTGVRAGDAVNTAIEVAGKLGTIGDAGQLRIGGAPAGGPGSACNFLCASGKRLFTGGHLGALFDAHSGQIFHRHHAPLYQCGEGADRFAKGLRIAKGRRMTRIQLICGGQRGASLNARMIDAVILRSWIAKKAPRYSATLAPYATARNAGTNGEYPWDAAFNPARANADYGMGFRLAETL